MNGGHFYEGIWKVRIATHSYFCGLPERVPGAPATLFATTSLIKALRLWRGSPLPAIADTGCAFPGSLPIANPTATGYTKPHIRPCRTLLTTPNPPPGDSNAQPPRPAPPVSASTPQARPGSHLPPPPAHPAAPWRGPPPPAAPSGWRRLRFSCPATLRRVRRPGQLRPPSPAG